MKLLEDRIKKDVKEYVEWFRITRRYSNPADEDKSRVLRIQFEDLIYNYEETSARVIDFVGIDPLHHTAPRSCFDPAKSIKNTNVAKRYPGCENDIKYIESELKEYLYDFDKYAE